MYFWFTGKNSHPVPQTAFELGVAQACPEFLPTLPFLLPRWCEPKWISISDRQRECKANCSSIFLQLCELNFFLLLSLRVE